MLVSFPIKHAWFSLHLLQMRTTLRDQKEVNVQLRHYIDNILMNIMEKYPEILEVRK